jgi:acyl-[acyl-carrier-protein]-phospholipid O-acyltransferase/long-chain-fatty-acid--[acyl-carrier-protein] ligase
MKQQLLCPSGSLAGKLGGLSLENPERTIDLPMQTEPSAKDTANSPANLRGFWSLIITQFEGAFNDNALKALVTFVGLNMALSQRFHEALLPLTAFLFSAPFILLSMAGGFLADRFSKRTITIGIKLLEIAIMAFATLGLFLKNLPMGLASVFLMGVHSALFGPSKYGLLPELLPERKLSWGNGILELGTFLAIITGIGAGSFLYTQFKETEAWAGLVLVSLAALGLFFSLGITRVPAADPLRRFKVNFLGDLWGQIKIMRQDRVLWLACLGNIYFWFIGQLLQQSVMDYGVNVLKVGELRTSGLLAALAIGIGVGSFAAGYLSGGKIEYGLVPLGSVGLTVFSALLWNPALGFWQILGLVGTLGFFGGFFIVPISAILQHRPSRETKGVVLAAANLLSSAGLCASAGVYWLLASCLHWGPRGVFMVGAVMTLGATIYLVLLLPDALLRFALWLATRTLYRVRILGRENIPAKGGALFVCNHLSLVDALLLQASTDRPIRFIIYKGIYESAWVKPFAKILHCIPISSELRPREMLHSLRTATQALQDGEVVCIFAEGQITRIGQMLPFRRGFERIMRNVDAPIIPIALDGLYGSIFSFEKGQLSWRLPSRIPQPVTVNFGAALPATAKPLEVRQAVQELMEQAWACRKPRLQPLQRAFIRTARRHPFRFAMADANTPKVTFGAALARTVLLARRLRPLWSGQKMVGLLLPPSIPGSLVNYAALLMGKAPVNLNYTVSESTLASCIQQCEIKTIITSRAFLERVKLKVSCKTVFLEDLIGRGSPSDQTALPAPGAGEKLAAFLMAWLLPSGALERALGREQPIQLDDLATIIFSSGSTGDPKGVMLSHYNVVSNIGQLEQVFTFEPKDRIMGILPFFHSFGFTGALSLPAALGIGVVYHPNPLDAKSIGRFINDYAVSFLLATPTFLQFYMRACSPEQFGSLRLVITGAEKLPDRLAIAFEERFGIRPLEAYGCTECAPAVAVNTRDYRSAGFRQVGAKRGKIGHPLPGMCVRILDTETGALVPAGQPGLLSVRGPNVMQGYLGRPEKTAEVLRDGWYMTGDVAAMDEDGFLQITDRLSRFSKIGGEMVPHIKVEEKLHELAGLTEQAFVVASLPDEKKGERLVVLHKLAEAPLSACLEKLAASDLPNLWKPRADQFFKIDALPYLGTGKLDLRQVKEIAARLAAA